MYDYHVVRFVPHHKIHSSRLRGTCIARIILFQQFLSFLLWSFFPSYIHFSLPEGRLPSYNVSNTRILYWKTIKSYRFRANQVYVVFVCCVQKYDKVLILFDMD